MVGSGVEWIVHSVSSAERSYFLSLTSSPYDDGNIS